MATRLSHVIAPERREEFAAGGHRLSSFFPHSLRVVPKAGPDAQLLAERMTGSSDPDRHWEILLHAEPPTIDEFPPDLFFDDDLVWHQQQLGLPGHIASVNAVLDGEDVWSTGHVSDVVQRIALRREHKTRIDTVFGGWHDMLLNGLLWFAAERGARRVYVPRAPLAIANTGRRRWVKPELFERIYDRDVNRLYGAQSSGDWWRVDVEANRERIVAPVLRRETRSRSRIVCLCHDVEGGLGHVGVDDALAAHADRTWRASVAEMLRIEGEHGARATYNVVGRLLPQVRPEIEDGGHCLAFHSFDHRLEADSQLERCRSLDYRLKGYRAPRSLITPELTDERLLFHNFEWLAASPNRIGVTAPVLQRRIVRVPVDFDDFSLYDEHVDYADWQKRTLATIEARDVTVFSLHDCYADLWLPRYDELLARVSSLAELWTVDDLAADATLAAAE